MARTKRAALPVQPGADQHLYTAAAQPITQIENAANQTLRHLQYEQEALEERLRAGEEWIAAARSRGEDVSRWESHWLGLLTDYERTADEIGALLDQVSLRKAA